MGKYVILVKAYDKTCGMVAVRKVFKGDKKTAYEWGMAYAFEKANHYNAKGVDFSVTIQGESWRTAANVKPM